MNISTAIIITIYLIGLVYSLDFFRRKVLKKIQANVAITT